MGHQPEGRPLVAFPDPGTATHLIVHQSRFFALLQKDALDRRQWATREELQIAIVIRIEKTYHRRRIRDRLGRLTQIEFETIMTTQVTGDVAATVTQGAKEQPRNITPSSTSMVDAGTRPIGRCALPEGLPEAPSASTQ